MLTKPGKYNTKYDNDKSNKEETDNRNCFVCGKSWPHKNGKSLCPALGHHCKRCVKQNNLERKT